MKCVCAVHCYKRADVAYRAFNPWVECIHGMNAMISAVAKWWRQNVFGADETDNIEHAAVHCGKSESYSARLHSIILTRYKRYGYGLYASCNTTRAIHTDTTAPYSLTICYAIRYMYAYYIGAIQRRSHIEMWITHRTHFGIEELRAFLYGWIVCCSCCCCTLLRLPRLLACFGFGSTMLLACCVYVAYKLCLKHV